jgi:hypothetical protein
VGESGDPAFPGQVVTDQIATTIDFAPTFLEAAGIENTYGFYGLSLHKLANHEVYRQKFLYEFGPDDHTPVIRGIRTLTGKYITDNCSSTTEEFYDLVADPKENANLINKPEYQDSVQLYRQWLDTLRNNFGDTVQASPFNCTLVNNFPDRMADEIENENEFGEAFVHASPNPTAGAFTVSFYVPSGSSADEICIYDAAARMVSMVAVSGNAGELAMENNHLDPGIYSLVLRHDGKMEASTKLVITK